MVKDPVCGMEIEEGKAHTRQEHGGRVFYFCSPKCEAAFAANPARYAGEGRRRHGRQAPSATTGVREGVGGVKRIELPVFGLTCDKCVQAVEKALRAVPGVKKATVNLTAQRAFVDYDPTHAGLPALERAIRDAGYRTEGAKARALARFTVAFFTPGTPRNAFSTAWTHLVHVRPKTGSSTRLGPATPSRTPVVAEGMCFPCPPFPSPAYRAGFSANAAAHFGEQKKKVCPPCSHLAYASPSLISIPHTGSLTMLTLPIEYPVCPAGHEGPSCPYSIAMRSRYAGTTACQPRSLWIRPARALAGSKSPCTTKRRFGGLAAVRSQRMSPSASAWAERP